MTIDRALEKKTDRHLMESIQRAASKQLTADEVLAQRVSFAFGSVGKKNHATREHVRDVILGLQGAPTDR